MGELRKDYVLDQWVIIAAKRGQRPHELLLVGRQQVHRALPGQPLERPAQ